MRFYSRYVSRSRLCHILKSVLTESAINIQQHFPFIPNSFAEENLLAHKLRQGEYNNYFCNFFFTEHVTLPSASTNTSYTYTMYEIFQFQLHAVTLSQTIKFEIFYVESRALIRSENVIWTFEVTLLQRKLFDSIILYISVQCVG